MVSRIQPVTDVSATGIVPNVAVYRNQHIPKVQTGGISVQAAVVRDATAAFSPEAMHAAHEINAPTFAHAILTTEAVIAALGANQTSGGEAASDPC